MKLHFINLRLELQLVVQISIENETWTKMHMYYLVTMGKSQKKFRWGLDFGSSIAPEVKQILNFDIRA